MIESKTAEVRRETRTIVLVDRPGIPFHALKGKLKNNL